MSAQLLVPYLLTIARIASSSSTVHTRLSKVNT